MTIGTMGQLALYAIFKAPGLKSDINALESFTQVKSPSGKIAILCPDFIFSAAWFILFIPSLLFSLLIYIHFISFSQ